MCSYQLVPVVACFSLQILFLVSRLVHVPNSRFLIHLDSFLVSYHFRLTVQDSSCAYRLTFLHYWSGSWQVDLFWVLSDVLWCVVDLPTEPHFLVVIFQKYFFHS